MSIPFYFSIIISTIFLILEHGKDAFNRKILKDNFIKEFKCIISNEESIIVIIFELIVALCFGHILIIMVFVFGWIKDFLLLPLKLYSYLKDRNDIKIKKRKLYFDEMHIKYNASVKWWKENGGLE
jgi:hypothetical protein